MGRYFREFGSDRHFASFYFRDYPKGVANLHRVDQWVSLPLSTNNHYRHTLSMKSSLELALRPVSFILQVRNIHVLHHSINEYSPKRDICWDICLHHMLKSSLFPRVQGQIFQIQQLCIHTQCSVILACHWWYKLFVHWWMKGIYFASFYFCVWDQTREIRKNKNPAKISTYTVSNWAFRIKSKQRSIRAPWEWSSAQHHTLCGVQLIISSDELYLQRWASTTIVLLVFVTSR